MGKSEMLDRTTDSHNIENEHEDSLFFFKNKLDFIHNINDLPQLISSFTSFLSTIQLNFFISFYKKIEDDQRINLLNDYIICNDNPNLPDWWVKNGNQLLLPKNFSGVDLPLIKIHPGYLPPKNYLLVLNGSTDYLIMLWGNGGLLYLAPDVRLPSSEIALGGGVVFFGKEVRTTSRLKINCRNGGLVLLENDILIASDIHLMTDDCHTIISIKNGKRINPYGGVISIGRHVWIGDRSLIMGNSVIKENSIIGACSFVRNFISSKGNCILAGAPASVIKDEITWDVNDLAP